MKNILSIVMLLSISMNIFSSFFNSHIPKNMERCNQAREFVKELTGNFPKVKCEDIRARAIGGMFFGGKIFDSGIASMMTRDVEAAYRKRSIENAHKILSEDKTRCEKHNLDMFKVFMSNSSGSFQERDCRLDFNFRLRLLHKILNNSKTNAFEKWECYGLFTDRPSVYSTEDHQ